MAASPSSLAAGPIRVAATRSATSPYRARRALLGKPLGEKTPGQDTSSPPAVGPQVPLLLAPFSLLFS